MYFMSWLHMGRYGSEKRYLGIVRSVAPMGLIVVSMDRRKPIPLGSKVYFRDDSGAYRELGVVVDVIGNVERPHAVVRVHERSSLNENGYKCCCKFYTNKDIWSYYRLSIIICYICAAEYNCK
jgi:rRNA processing protein Gar1